MTYEELIVKKSGVTPQIIPSAKDTALVLIDMQNLATAENIVREAVAAGLDEEEARQLCQKYHKLERAATDKAAKLLAVCREKGIRPIHVKIQSYAGDASDTGGLHKRLNFQCPPTSWEAEWIPEVAPEEGEVVLIKTCSGAVVGTPIERVLLGMDIKKCYCVGFYTDQCVETTVRDLADCGFECELVLDATATETEKRYNNTIENICNVYCASGYTDEIIEKLKRLQ